MARIRTIKPEFWKHEDLSELPPEVHMLAAALLNYADDEGYFRAHPKLIEAECCPLRNDSTPVEDALQQLAAIGYLRLFTGSDQKRYGHIVKFTTHQTISRPQPSKIAPLDPGDRETQDGTFASESGDDDGSTYAQSPGHGPLMDGSMNVHGTDIEDSSGKGRERKGTGGRAHAREGPQDHHDQQQVTGEKPRQRTPPSSSDGFAELAAEIQQTIASPKPLDCSPVRQWLADGCDPQDVLAAVREIMARCQAPPNSIQYFRAKAYEKRDERRANSVTSQRERELNQWRHRVRSYRDRGLWLDRYGPEPGRPRCEVPPEVLREFGYEPELEHA